MADVGIDHLVKAVQAKGFSARTSRTAVKAVVAAMKSALARGESVETPVGILAAKKHWKRKGRQHVMMLIGGTRYGAVNRNPKLRIELERTIEFP